MTVGDVTASECRSPASASPWEYIAPSAMMVTAARTPNAVTASSPHADRSRLGSSQRKRARLRVKGSESGAEARAKGDRGSPGLGGYSLFDEG